MAKTLVIITSYNRPHSLDLLATNLILQDCDVVVFDDASDKEFVVDMLSNENIKVIRSATHRGKAGFWKTYNDIFA